MTFFIKDDDLMEKYTEFWNKVSISIKKELDCKPIYNKKNLITKIRSSGNGGTDFDTRKICETGSNYICWSVI